MIRVVLRGGPSGLGPVSQVLAAEGAEKVAVTYYGQHVHFELTDEVEMVEGRALRVYRWVYSTAVAE
ncbi:DUF5988 family protein [Kitasatospora sp. NPDC005751]|uniref:DUF5988 family protein n=1 Tax=unclassified Kitasatospora TaxID=2633591 RepID=UPI0033FC1DB5